MLLVAGPSTEPALAAVVTQSLGRVGPEPVIVVNRAEGEARSVGGAPAASCPIPGWAPSWRSPDASLAASLGGLWPGWPTGFEGVG